MKKIFWVVLILIVLVFIWMGNRKEENLNIQDLNQEKQNTPTILDEESPIIESISPNKVKIGDKVRVQGKNLSGFEGDIHFLLENSLGEKGWIFAGGNYTKNPDDFEFTLEDKYCKENNSYTGDPCESWLNVIPGKYHIQTSPWGKNSNKVEIEIF